MNHYICIAFNTDKQLIQLHVEIEDDDPRFVGPLRCCTSAASRNFWRKYLAEFGVDSVGSIKKITNTVPYRAF